MAARRFRAFSMVVLAAVLAVILWGAFVRASGAGAGCGSHWPTCNGQVIPRAPSTKTLIEFTHRLTSGVSLLLVVAQFVWALRAWPRGHLARRGATAAMVFMLTEALVGAGLVLFEMVAENKSVARGAWTMVHLGNTFALVGALTVTWWASALPARGERRGSPGGRVRWLLALGLAGVVVVACSGAVAALGDTLFPARTLAEGMRDDLSSTAHLFVRLRVLHPVLAAAVALYLLGLTGTLAARAQQGARAAATVVAALVLVQVGVGFLNLVLLAPTTLQLVHLLLADFVWIALVSLTCELTA